MIDPTDPFATRPRLLTRLPRLVRLYVFNAAFGFLMAALFTGLVMALNIAGVRHLVLSVEGGWLALVVFFMLNGIVFGGVQTAITVMTMPTDES